MIDLFNAATLKLPFDIPSGLEYSASSNVEQNAYDIIVPNGEIFYAENFFSDKVSDRSLEYFQENDVIDWREANWRNISSEEFDGISFDNIKWKQDSVQLYGKSIPLPRLTSWYGDSGKSYTYSGIRSQPNTWNKGLLYLKSEVEACAGVKFNSVLLNWYRDGGDHLSWHSDDEKELGINPIIASANFGETRDFVLRRKDDHDTKIVLPLKHGTLLVMSGEIQRYWQHSVPKRKNVRGSRFNLTFRRIGL